MNVGALDIALRLSTAGFSTGVSSATRGMKSIGDSAIRLNQALELASKGFGAFKQVGDSLLEAGMKAQRFDNAFKQITGSTKAASAELQWLRDVSERLGLEFEGVADAYKGIAAAAKDTKLEGQGVRDVFTSVAEGATVLGLSVDDTKGVLYALQQMLSKGVVSSEELKQQLGERLPGAFKLAAKAIGKTEYELTKLLETGQIVAADFLPKFAKAMHEEFGGAALEAAQSAQANLNRFKNAWFDLQVRFANTGFLDAASGAFKNLADKLKDPEVQAKIEAMAVSFGELAKSLGDGVVPAMEGLIGVFGDLKQTWDGIDPTLRQAVIGAWLGKKVGGVPGMIGGAVLGGQRGYASTLSDMEKVEGTLKRLYEYREMTQTAAGIGSGIDVSAELKDLEQQIAYYEQLREVIKGAGEERRRQAEAQFRRDDVKRTAEYDASLQTAPLAPVKKDLEEISGPVQEIITKLRQANVEAKAAFDKTGLDDYQQGLIDMQVEMDALRQKYKEAMSGVGGDQVKKQLDDYEVLKKQQLERVKAHEAEKEKLERVKAAQEMLNQTVAELDSAIRTADMPKWQQSLESIRLRLEQSKVSADDYAEALAKVQQRLQDIARQDADRFIKDSNDDLATRGMDSNLASIYDRASAYREAMKQVAFDQTKVNELMAQQTKEIEAAKAEIASGSMNYEDWTVGIGRINKSLDDLAKQMGKTGEEAKAFKAEMLAAFELSMVSTEIRGTLDAMEGPLADFFATFAKTGRASLQELGAAMVEQLQLIAAQKTAHLLMEAFYHSIMSFVDPSGVTNGGVSHSAAAAKATQGAAMMGSFVLGSGLMAGMAHDGIRQVPDDGTWLLQKGERVLDKDTTRGMDELIANGGAGNSVSLSFTNTFNGDVDPANARKAAAALSSEIERVVDKNMRTNGRIRRSIQQYG